MQKIKPKKAIIIGAGYGGLGAAALLGKAGWQVTVIEKNEMVGGRATVFSVAQDKDGTWQHLPEDISSDAMQGGSENSKRVALKGATSAGRSDNVAVRADNIFRFDMGPSWYLMPDVFEHFFDLLGEDVHSLLDLKKLGPSYRVFYKDLAQKIDIYSDLKRDLPTLEKIEKGAGESLKKYLKQAEYQYTVAKDRFMYKNYDSIRDFFTREMVNEGRKLSVLSSMNTYVGKYFKTEQLQKIMQYPLVFLGSSPYNTPAIYNIMSHIDFNMGVYYPQGGIYKITQVLKDIGEQYGVKYVVNTPVQKILVENKRAIGVKAGGKTYKADIVVSNGDIYHTDRALLDKKYHQYSERYWRKRTLAPSALIMYLGVKGRLPSLTHHNLLFSRDWKKNFAEIFDRPPQDGGWPSDPSFYVCAPSKTDKSVAPKGHENLFVLVPIASNLHYTQEELEIYADKVLETMERQMSLPGLRKKIVYKELFCVKDFAERYNSYGGSALGLAHTLKQTAAFRPNNVHKKVKNLYFVGANTNPGIGMPSTLISAELLYKRLIDDKSSGPLTPDQLNS